MIQSFQFDPALRPVALPVYTPHRDNSIVWDIRQKLKDKYVLLYLPETGVTIEFPDVLGGLLV